MLQYTKYIDNGSILGLIRRSCNYVDSRLMDHGFRVADTVSRLLEHRDSYDAKKKRDICLLALLHDIGAYKTEEISRMLQFETENIWEHSIYGSLFIQYFSPLGDLADLVLFHHIPWNTLKHQENISDESKELAQMIHIADRIDIFMQRDQSNSDECMKRLELGRNTQFAPHILDLISEKGILSSVEDTDQNPNSGTGPELYQGALHGVPFTQQEINDYLVMLIFLIDFRSGYTVTHTITTTTISYQLAVHSGLSAEQINQVVCGALLHDLGKIGIPVEILEFPDKLSPQAMSIMRTHVDITEQIFNGDIEECIQKIALRHHEKLDGSGYPRALTAKDLSTSERIVAIADIVSALSGTRSYKQAYPKDKIVAILSQMRDSGSIDRQIVDLMIADFDEIMEQTEHHCQPVIDTYQGIQADYMRMLREFTGNDVEKPPLYT